MQRTDTKRKPSCPRCGYDLRGVMSLWQESCPLMGKCSECGLDYEWSVVCDPLKYEPKWGVEFSPGWKSVPISSFKTFCISFVPWYFWSRLQMSYPIRWKRLVFYFLALLLPYVIAYVLVQGTAAIIIRHRTQVWLDNYVQQLPQFIQGMQGWLQNPLVNREGISEEEYNELMNNRIAQANQALASLRQMQKTPPTLSWSYPEAVLEAIFLPFAETSFGNMVPGLSLPYTAPINLHEEVINPIDQIRFSPGMRFKPGNWPNLRNLLFIVSKGFSVGLIGLIVFPFTFVLLPVSRRNAKVRWSQIARVTVYHFFIPSTLLSLCIILCVAGMLVPPLFNAAAGMVYVLSLWGILVGMVIWWSVAIKRYLKMPHGIAISVLLCFMIVLVMAVIA